MTSPIETLTRRVGAIEAELFTVLERLRLIGESADRSAQAIDDFEDALAELAEAAAPPTPEVTPPEPTQTNAVDEPDLDEWVDTYIAALVRKTTTTGEGGGIRWCRRWRDHPEAVLRFTALHQAYQQLATEDSGTWLSVYLRDHLDPHLAALTSPYGPFHACTPRKHSTAVEPLGTEQPAQQGEPT